MLSVRDRFIKEKMNKDDEVSERSKFMLSRRYTFLDKLKLNKSFVT